MKAGGGHSKGARFEREVCKALSLWVSDGERDDIFWRTAMSGGRATIGLRQGRTRSAQAADVSAIDALGERLLDVVLVECKSYRDLEVIRGILGGAGLLRGFWNELEGKAKRFGKRSMLIARQNGLPAFVVIDEYIATTEFKLKPLHAVAHLPAWNCSIFLFDTFLAEAYVPRVGARLPRRRIVL